MVQFIIDKIMSMFPNMTLEEIASFFIIFYIGSKFITWLIDLIKHKGVTLS